MIAYGRRIVANLPPCDECGSECRVLFAFGHDLSDAVWVCGHCAIRRTAKRQTATASRRD